MDVTGRLAAVAAVVGGLGLAFAFSPWSVPGLAPAALAVFFVAVGDRQLRGGAVLGFVFGLAFFGPTLWWLSQSIAPAAWAALVTLQAGWLAVFGAGSTLVRRLPGWPVWTAALWTSVEGVRSSFPWGGLPWGRLGYTALDTPWAGVLAVVGVAGTGTAVALSGAVIALVAERVSAGRVLASTRPVLVGCSIGGVLLLAIGAWSPWEGGDAGPAHTGQTATVGIVQASVPGDGTDVGAHHREITRTLLLETQRLGQESATAERVPDLVVWPENATAVDPATDETARTALLSAVGASGAPVLAGSIVDGPTSATALNQAIVWSTTGPQGRYTKQHLVPFGEYVPLRPLADRVSARVSDIQRDMVPGPSAFPLKVDDLLVANALCFDVAYDDVLREQVALGAGLAVVQTSNAMFLGTAQQEQQWVVTRARAIEVGRAIVVSSMNGISGAIAADGTVIARLPDTESGSAMVSVEVRTEKTLAVRLGSWPPRTAYIVGAASVLMAAWTRSRRSGAATRPTRTMRRSSVTPFMGPQRRGLR